MLKRFDDKTPLNYGHAYCFDKTEEWKAYIRKHWMYSKFYRDFHDVPFVRDAKPWDADPLKSLDAKLYAGATMYRNVKRIEIPESIKLTFKKPQGDVGIFLEGTRCWDSSS
jgi:hypothetical protein